MSLSERERRPSDDGYYAERSDYLRQGDLFREVPLGYPMPPDAVNHEEGKRKFLSGPFESGFGILLTPTCSMHAQGGSGYAHPVRVLAPVLSVERLVQSGAVKDAALPDVRTFDHLMNYLYLPPIEAYNFPESLALIYGAITVHHDYLVDHRIAQLGEDAAIHLKLKLAAHFSGSLFSHADFEDDRE